MGRDPSATETDPEHAGRTVPRPPRDAAVALPALDPDAYEVLGEIARGGMGRILRARDRRLDRLVAIKQLLTPGSRLAALFEREVRITARLQHPSIVSVYEAGVLPGGELVYAMKLVPGRALKDVLREPRSVAERLALLPMVSAVADALAYAHQQRVIHRDLKPGNVLVGEFGEVVVIDWGLAEEIAETEERAGARAREADEPWGVMGTPAYMAPEAARGERLDERADVYAIGAILREALTGEPPYRGDDGAALLAAVRAGPPEPLERVAPGVPADLAAIVDKAMARDLGARYPTARELADELRRFQTGQLVSAHAYSLGERAWRWLRRNRAPVAVAAGAGALVVALVGFGFARIVRERDRADASADQLRIRNARLELDRDPRAALVTLADLPQRSSQWGAARVLAADARARGVAERLAAGDVAAIAIGRAGPRAIGREGAVVAVAASADGDVVATLEPGGAVRVRSADGAGPRVLLAAGPRAGVRLAVSPDGTAVAAAGRDFGMRAWTVDDGVERVRDDAARAIDVLAVGAGARRVAFAGGAIIDLRQPGVQRSIDAGAEVRALVLRDDELAFATDRGDVRIEPLDAGARPEGVRLDGAPSAIAVSPDGGAFAAAVERDVIVWTGDGRRRRRLSGLRAPIAALAIDDRASTIVAIDPHGAWVWRDLGDGERLGRDAVAGVDVAVAAGTIATIDADGGVVVWDLAGHRSRALGAHASAGRAIAIAPDGARVATVGDDRTVRLWSADGRDARVLGSHRAAALAVAFAPDGATIATGGVDRVVRLWDVAGGGRPLGEHAGPVVDLAFTDDGKRLISIADEPAAIVWDLTGTTPPRRLVHGDAVTALAISRDGARVVTGTRAGEVVAWSLATGTARTIARHGGPVRAIAIAPDGRHVGSASDDGDALITDLDGARVVLSGHADFVRRIVFADDGATAITAGDDGTVRIWDVASGEGRALRAGGWVADVALADGGARVLATGSDGGLWSWRDDLPRDRRALRAAIVAAARPR